MSDVFLDTSSAGTHEKLLRLLAQETSAIVWETDGELRLTSCFGPGLAVLGLTPERAVGMTLDDFFQTGDAQSPVITAHHRALRGESVVCDVELAGNTYRAVVVSQQEEGIRGGGCIGLIRQAIATEVPESDFKRLFQLSLQLLCIAGTDGYFKRVNPAFRTTLGYPPGEMLCRPFIEFVHPADQGSTLEEVRKLSEGVPTIRFENRFRCQNGTYRWLAWTAMPQPDGLLYATALDVTDRKRAEHLFRGLLESAPDATVITDGDGRIFLVNALTEQLFGYSRNELAGEPVETLIPERFRSHHKTLRLGFVEERRMRAMGAGRELSGLRKDGTEFSAEISLSVLQTEEQTLVFSAIRDVTERKRMENAMREREVQLVAAQRIQEYLLPRHPPALSGFDIAGASRPAEFAGGDHFDFLSMPEGALGVVVSDVSGHSIGSAILVASVHSHFHSLAETELAPGKILARVNRVLYQETEDQHFVTALFLRLDPQSRTLVYAGAGHPTGYVLDSSGTVKHELTSTSLPLAVDPGEEFSLSCQIALETGDLIVLHTDGVPEAISTGDAVFGTDRALQIVRENRDLPAADIIKTLHHAVLEFSSGRLIDDVTSVVIKVKSNE